MPSQTPQAVFFDFDGVIADTLNLMNGAMKEYFQAHGRQDISKQDLYSVYPFASMTLSQVCAFLNTKFGLTLETEVFRLEILAIQKRLMTAWVSCDPYLVPFLNFLRSCGIPFAIGSQAGKVRVDAILDAMGLRDFFGANILGIHEFLVPKPDPAVWLKCAEVCEVDVRNALVIEDHAPGIYGAKEVGAMTIYYSRFARHADIEAQQAADFTCSSFEEIQAKFFSTKTKS